MVLSDRRVSSPFFADAFCSLDSASLESSIWGDFLATASMSTVSPADASNPEATTEEEASLQLIISQMRELGETFGHFKERYVSSAMTQFCLAAAWTYLQYLICFLILLKVQQVFHELNYSHHEELYSELHFPWLLSESDPTMSFQGRAPIAWMTFRVS